MNEGITPLKDGETLHGVCIYVMNHFIIHLWRWSLGSHFKRTTEEGEGEEEEVKAVAEVKNYWSYVFLNIFYIMQIQDKFRED